MQFWSALASGIIGGLGIGSALTALVQHTLRRREAAHQSQREALEARYKVMILLMYAAYDFKANETAIRIQRPDLKTRNEVLENLHAEWINAMLFASDRTLTALTYFLNDPSFKHLADCAVSMRQDLGRGQLPLQEMDVPVRLRVK
jgi:hypothetical protein